MVVSPAKSGEKVKLPPGLSSVRRIMETWWVSVSFI